MPLHSHTMTKEKLRKLNMWTREKIARLIQLYRQNECLWNPYHSMYKNKTTRIQAVDSICQQLNITKPDYGKKIHNLRNQFNSEMKKLERRIEEAGSTVDGSGSGPQRCRWEHFESLIFLQSVIEPRPGSYQMHNAKRIKCDYTSDEDPDNVIQQSDSTHAVASLPVEESSDYIYEEAPDDEGETTDNAAPSEEYQLEEDPSPAEHLKSPEKTTRAPPREDISIEVKFKPSVAKPTQASLANGSTLITLPMTTTTACNRKESTPLLPKPASNDASKLQQRSEEASSKGGLPPSLTVAASGPANVYSYPSSGAENLPSATSRCGSNRDQWDLFGELIASEFRNLNSEVSRKKLKRKMMQAMLEVGEEDDLHATS